jgi:hypothetical protein
MNSSPLETALAAKLPLPASNAEENRQLINQLAALRPRHRVSVDDHQRWQETGKPLHEDDVDIEDLLCEIRSAQPEERKPRR